MDDNVIKDTLTEEPIITEKEVFDVLEFSRAYSTGMYGSYGNPFLTNSRMQDVSLNTMQASQDELDKAMKEPKQNEFQLQRFSQDFELRSMVYKRLISYLANMLSFDVTYTSNAESTDYKTPKYKKDNRIVESFLDNFDYKKEFKIVIKEMLRNDAFFGCFRNLGTKYIIQELPSEYCKIDGRWENGFLFSFNMYFFLQPGVDIDMYPPFFKRKYKEIWESPNTTKKYNPALPPEMRGNSTWVYWVDVPTDVGVCLKFSPELATRLPYFTPLFNDLILQPLMRNLQKSTNMAAASKMIIGEVPMLNKEIKATVKDSMAISPDLLGKFMALVKSAISEAIRVASAPLLNMQGISFDGDNALYDSYLRTALATSGVNTNLIFSSNIKPNAIETQLSLNVDEQMMTILYEQFNEFLNYFVNRLTTNFKFNFAFEGTDFFLNRKQRLDTATTLFNQGIVMPQKIAAAIGMRPSQLRKHMEEAKALDFMSMLTPPSIEQQRQMQEFMPELPPTGGKTVPKADEKTGEQIKRGRPQKEDSELSDEGVATRGGGTNIARGGIV